MMSELGKWASLHFIQPFYKIFIKIAGWKVLSSAAKEDNVKMAKSGHSVLDIAHVQNVNGHNIHRII